jgi:hypothetical protein
MNLAVFDMPDLVYDIAHSYPGGIPALAVRLSMSSNVLNKQVNPAIDTHRLALETLIKLLDYADVNKRFTHAQCANNGGVFVSTEQFDGVSDMAVLETLTQLLARFGDLSQNLHKALSDRRVTEDEIRTAKQDMYALNAAGAELIARLESLSDKP